jgi:hypothetical protein
MARKVVAEGSRGRRLHHGRILVHAIDLVGQPRRHHRAGADRYLRRDPAGHVAPFIVAQLVGAAAATLLFRWLVPSPADAAGRVVVPQLGE